MNGDSANMAKQLFCFGLGYSGRTLANALIADGWTVSGTVRDGDVERNPETSGLDVRVFDGIHPIKKITEAFAGTSHLLSTIPPGAHGDPVLEHHGRDIVALRDPQWIGYLSTTGVYGDRAGDWVDEDSALEPTSARARHRVAAERAWLEYWHDHGLPVHIFRLAGIYGPGRSALDSLRAGTAKRIDVPGHVFSRIHVDDLVRVLRASMARPNPGAIYNVCDDEPAPPADVVRYAATLLGIAPPPIQSLESASLSPMALSFYRDNKRVRNRRIKDELGVSLLYPDYRAGLRALASRPR